jgi:hypothetical protein
MNTIKIAIIFLISLIGLAACTRQPDAKVDSAIRFLEQSGFSPLRGSPEFSAVSHGLSRQARLRKLSLHLRGQTPSEAEYQALDQQPEEAMASFFLTKTNEYLRDPAYVAKMVTRLDELFRLRVSVRPPEVSFGPSNAGLIDYTLYNPLDFQFEALAHQNLSWDTLLSGKVMRAASYEDKKDKLDDYDVTFFRDMLSSTSEPVTAGDLNGHKYGDFHFAADDPRVAGVVTTSRFFSRYGTTNVNKNRRRAAALFRIFLCDDMHAVVQSSAEDDQSLVDMAFPPPPKPDQIHAGIMKHDDPHVGDPSCAACHYKLDPLGRSFLTSGSTLSSEPSPGALIFKRADGSLVNVAGRGIGDVGAAILVQPEYARCQVSHFWKWFIQGDQVPTAARMEELVASFDRLERKTNDFVAYLVNQPEFYRDPNEISDVITLTQTKSVMERCNSCHANVLTATIPNFSHFPIGGEGEHAKWMEKIVRQLDLAHDGAARKMPPESSAWQPSAEELARLKRWIAEGVKDEAGRITVDPSLAEGWLKP